MAFTPPQPGVYYVFIQCPSLGVQYNQLPYLMLQAVEENAGMRQPLRSSPIEGAQTGAATAKLSIPDLALLNQDGEKIRFYSDLVKDRVVAINFIFTTCTTLCPPLATTFSKVQELMGDRLGKDFTLISISVDPVTDTPARLKAWGAKFGARPGWTLVTGLKPAMDQLLRALGASAAQKEEHSPTLLIGNDAKGVWTRAYGLMPPAQLVKLIDGVIEESRAKSP